jgi:hypothetical protein
VLVPVGRGVEVPVLVLVWEGDATGEAEGPAFDWQEASARTAVTATAAAIATEEIRVRVMPPSQQVSPRLRAHHTDRLAGWVP